MNNTPAENEKPGDYRIFRRSLITRSFYGGMILMATLLTLGFIVFLGLILDDGLLIFASAGVILFVVIAVLRPAIHTVFVNRTVFTPEGIEYHYMGLHGFAQWQDMLKFDYDDSHIWNRSVLLFSPGRVRVRVVGVGASIPVQNSRVWGIRLRRPARINRSFFTRHPAGAENFIPLSLLIKTGRWLPYSSVSVKHFQQGKAGQYIHRYAPHLF